MKGMNYLLIIVIVGLALGGLLLLRNAMTGSITGFATYGIQDSSNVSVIWDAYVAGASTNTNYGTNIDLLVKGGTPKDNFYVMFDISGIPSDQNIQEAEACFYLYNDQGDQNISIYHVYIWNSENETTITWNNQPCGTDFDNSTNCNLTAEDTINTDSNQDGTWQCWNVTNIVNYEYTQDSSNASVLLHTLETGNPDKYYSRDYTDDTSLRPYLNITYSSSNVAPTINLIEPQNTLYTENESLALNFTVSDDNDAVENLTCWYNIDDGSNVSISSCDNTTFDTSEGSHNFTVFVNDTGGLEGSDSVSFDVDVTGVSIAIEQPAGTKTSRTGIALNYNAVGINTTCWYNVKTSIGGDVIDNTTIAGCINTNFDVDADADYVVNLFVNNTIGSFDSDSSNFSVETSSGGSSGGGGSSRTTIVQPTNLTTELTIEPISNIVVNPGESKKMKLKVKNSGTSFLNDCILESIGAYSPWIDDGEIKDLAAGEEYEFVFDVNAPKEIGAGSYEFEMMVICQEVNANTKFSAEILDKKIGFEIKSVEREGSNGIKIIYLLKELSGIEQIVSLEFLLVNDKGKKVLEAQDERTIAANSEGEFVTKIFPDTILEGEHKMLVNINSETYSTFVQEDIFLAPFSGFSVFGEAGDYDTLSIIILISLFVVFAFFMIRKILSHHKKIKGQ